MAKQSPYQKYAKKPYRYTHPACKHSTHVFQAVAVGEKCDPWRGFVCSACNIIIRKLSAGERRNAEVA